MFQSFPIINVSEGKYGNYENDENLIIHLIKSAKLHLIEFK